jgi:D-alanine-D-alanine ligase
MSAKRKTTVAVLFGGRSVEHDVSVVTGNQVMRAFDPERYEVVPVYINRDGRWYTGEPLLDLKTFQNEVASMKGVKEAILSPATHHHGLIIDPATGYFAKSVVKRLDVVFPALHGSHGEDGTVQGLCELADVAYVGCGVLASAAANDKIMTKIILKQHGIPVVDGVHLSRNEWEADPDAVIRRITAALSYPMFVKPATLGSSIGVGRANDETILRASLDVATHFDKTVLVEQAVTDGIEINCAVLGSESTMRASVLEQPVSWDQFLTYEEKYMRGGEGMKSADRLIPAPLNDDLTAKIKDITLRGFKAIGGRGTARIDFLVRPEQSEVYLNEINTMPGSLAFYLWQHEGLSPAQVVTELVECAKETQAEKRRNTYNYQTNLIEVAAMRGLKGVKGAKAMRNA